MRIVGGVWGGRHIEAPRGRDTRPTADRVREAVFSAIASRIGPLEGCAVADLYAGSGALGLEALSRGAVHVTFVDRDRKAADTIRANLASLGADPASFAIVLADARRAGTAPLVGGPVSLLFADPPYRIDAAEVRHILEGMADSGALRPGALVVYEHAHGAAVEWPAGFAGEPERRYGDTGVSFGRYEGGL
jgi:16S rRNA (guanine966-N2)-methyltransferase